MPRSLAPETTDENDRPLRSRSRLWKWTRRGLIFAGGLLLLAVVSLFGGRAYFRHDGRGELAAETAKLDAEHPGWRFTDLMAAREKAAPPDEQNSAVVVRRVRELTPKEWNDWVSRPNLSSGDPVPLNRRQADEDLIGSEELFDSTRAARDLGQTLRDFPRGYHAVVVPEIPFLLNLDESQGARHVVNLLSTDGVHAAQGGDPRRALRAAHAVLNTARSVGDEPTLISSLVRFAGGNISVTTTMRALALVDPKKALPELAALQAALLAEADEPIFLNGLRGELALMNLMFDKLESGQLTPDQLAGAVGGHGTGAEGRVVFYFRRAFLPGDQARFQHYMNAFIAAAKRPHHEQREALANVESTIRDERDIRYAMSRLMLPACEKCGSASLQHRAGLLCTATLIACERFRLAHGKWPESLAELPKELLPTIPLDPYDGKPLKFAKLPDGVAVYTVGTGPNRNNASELKRLNNPLGGSEIGWRLYDPPARGLPPLPKPKTEDMDEKP